YQSVHHSPRCCQSSSTAWEERTMKFWRSAAVAAAAVLGLSATAEAQVLRVASTASVTDIDPHGANSVLRDTILAVRQIFDPLIEFQNGEPVGRLATDWEQVDD